MYFWQILYKVYNVVRFVIWSVVAFHFESNSFLVVSGVVPCFLTGFVVVSWLYLFQLLYFKTKLNGFCFYWKKNLATLMINDVLWG